MGKIYASKSDKIEKREVLHGEISRQLAGECVVLLENDGALPFTGKSVALYGNAVRNTVRGGTGSGDVNTRDNVTIEQGAVHAGIKVITGEFLARQDAALKAAKDAYMQECSKIAEANGAPIFTVMFDNPFKEPAALVIEDDDIDTDKTDTAIYCVSRNSGEGADRYDVKGDYYFFDEEIENIKLLSARYDKTIVLLNIGGVMDLTPLREIEGLNSVVLMGQLGNLGGDAIWDVLTGKVNPSGKLVDTWAENYLDYPSSEKFSHRESVHDEDYTDGIYVGYRYFDTFGVEPTYPFGYGISYTSFAIDDMSAAINGDKISVSAKVTNTGSVPGKEVVQVYVSAHSGMLDKPSKELKEFAKTGLIGAGESETVNISFAAKDLASYDVSLASWVIEKGNYIVKVGNSSDSVVAVAVIKVEEDIVTEKLKNILKLDKALDEIKPEAGCDEAVDGLPVLVLDKNAVTAVAVEYQNGREILKCDKAEKLTLQDVKDGKCTLDELVAQLTVKEMALLCVGTNRSSDDEVVGNASQTVPGAAGDTSPVVRDDRGIDTLILADGPAGLRLQAHFKTDKDGNILKGGGGMGDVVEEFDDSCTDAVDYYQYTTAIPIGWSLAMSWNMELCERAGDMVGTEMEQFGVDLWLAPALNIHRNPLCGRNFEYYSEDPLIAGKVTAAITNGVQKHTGKGTTIKHFACNNQEDNRYFVNAHVGERALREIYLKGFEIAVKESHPLSVMTSYNLLNGEHTANSYDLLQSVLRDEWGFDGFVMTDWFTSQNVPFITGKFKPQYPISASTGCIAAGNDVQMPGCQLNVDDIVKAVESGEEVDGYKITLGDLQYCAKNVIGVVMKCR